MKLKNSTIFLIIYQVVASFEHRYVPDSEELDKNHMHKSISNRADSVLPRYDLELERQRKYKLRYLKNNNFSNKYTLNKNVDKSEKVIKSSDKLFFDDSLIDSKFDTPPQPSEVSRLEVQNNANSVISIQNTFVNETHAIPKFPIYFTNPTTGIVYAISEVGYNFSIINANKRGDTKNSFSDENKSNADYKIPIYIPKEQYDKDIRKLKSKLKHQCTRMLVSEKLTNEKNTTKSVFNDNSINLLNADTPNKLRKNSSASILTLNEFYKLHGESDTGFVSVSPPAVTTSVPGPNFNRVKPALPSSQSESSEEDEDDESSSVANPADTIGDIFNDVYETVGNNEESSSEEASDEIETHHNIIKNKDKIISIPTVSPTKPNKINNKLPHEQPNVETFDIPIRKKFSLLSDNFKPIPLVTTTLASFINLPIRRREKQKKSNNGTFVITKPINKYSSTIFSRHHFGYPNKNKSDTNVNPNIHEIKSRNSNRFSSSESEFVFEAAQIPEDPTYDDVYKHKAGILILKRGEESVQSRIKHLNPVLRRSKTPIYSKTDFGSTSPFESAHFTDIPDTQASDFFEQTIERSQNSPITVSSKDLTVASKDLIFSKRSIRDPKHKFEMVSNRRYKSNKRIARNVGEEASNFSKKINRKVSKRSIKHDDEEGAKSYLSLNRQATSSSKTNEGNKNKVLRSELNLNDKIEENQELNFKEKLQQVQHSDQRISVPCNKTFEKNQNKKNQTKYDHVDKHDDDGDDDVDDDEEEDNDSYYDFDNLFEYEDEENENDEVDQEKITDSAYSETLNDYNAFTQAGEEELSENAQQNMKKRKKKTIEKQKKRKNIKYKNNAAIDSDENPAEHEDEVGLAELIDAFSYPFQFVFRKFFERFADFTGYKTESDNQLEDGDEYELSATNDKRRPKFPKYTIYNNTHSDVQNSSEGSWLSSFFGSWKRNSEATQENSGSNGWFDYWFSDYDDEKETSSLSVADEDYDYGSWISNWFQVKSSSKKADSKISLNNPSTTDSSVPILTIENPMKNSKKWIGILAQHIVDSTSSTSAPTVAAEDEERLKLYDKFQIWRLKPNEISILKAVQRFQKSVDGNQMQWLQGPSLRGLTDVLVPPELITNLQGTLNYEQISHEVLIYDVGKAIEYERGKEQLMYNNTMTRMSTNNFSWNKYHSYDDIVRFVENLQVRNTEFVELINIGRSYEGRPLIVVKIAAKDSEPKVIKKLKDKIRQHDGGVLIEAGIQGRDWITPAAATWIINELVKLMKSNETGQQSAFIKKTTWYILPVLNPDGYHFTQKYDRMWGKSRSKHLLKSTGIINSAMEWFQDTSSNKICRGVNFDQNWNSGWSDMTSSKLSCNELYAGPMAFSEPETRAFSKFLLDHRKSIKLFISLKAYGQIISYPNQFNSVLSSQKLDELLDVAMVGNDGLRKSGSENRYKVDSNNDLLPDLSGSSHYFALYEASIPFSYSLHLGDNGVHGYLLPGSNIESTSKDAFQIIKSILNYIN